MIRKIALCLIFSLLRCAAYAQYAANVQFSPGYNEWVKMAADFYNAGQYRQSADAYSHAFVLNGGKGYTDDNYNAACSYAQAGNKDTAFFYLDRIAENGSFTDADRLEMDTNLTSLHTDVRWGRIYGLVKQNKEKAEVHLNKPLIAVLDTIFQDDQQYRMQADDVMQTYGSQSKEMDDIRKTISKYDSIDLIKIAAIISQYGWPGPDIAGSKGNETVFLVIQHSDIKTQDKYLPLMREAVKKNKASPADLALLEDRVALRHGKKQVYGSQVTQDMKGSFVAPLEDPDNVDKRRAEIGLGPIAESLKRFQMTWNVEEYKKQLPDFEKRQSNIQY